MTTPPNAAPSGIRARDADRQATIAVLRAANSAEQLAPEEFETRSRAAASAVTLGDLLPLTADLPIQPTIDEPPGPGAGDDATPHASPEPVTRPTSRPSAAASGPGRRLAFGFAGLGILTAAAVGIMLFVAAVSGNSSLGGGDAELHTADGFAEFVSDTRAELGTTEIASVVVYPTYAVLSVPVDGEPRHLDSYYYDGSFDDPSPSGTRDDDEPLVDLADLDGEVVAQLVAQAPDALGVAEPTSVYFIAEAWGDPSQPAVSVYANDSYESGYLVAAADGHLLDAYPAGG